MPQNEMVLKGKKGESDTSDVDFDTKSHYNNDMNENSKTDKSLKTLEMQFITLEGEQKLLDYKINSILFIFHGNYAFMHHGFLVKPGMTHLENACNCHSCESRNPCPLTVKKIFTLLFKEDTINNSFALLTTQMNNTKENLTKRIDSSEKNLRQQIDNNKDNLNKRIDSSEKNLSQKIDDSEKNLSQRIESLGKSLESLGKSIDDKTSSKINEAKVQLVLWILTAFSLLLAILKYWK